MRRQRDLEHTLATLRTQLQACQSRNRLALQGLNWLRERLMVVGRLLPVEELGEVLLRVDTIHTLLDREEVTRG
jgi:hypothetical protein